MKKFAVIALGLLVSGAVSAADWVVSYDQDEMCGTAQKFIQNESDNAVEFDFPYDGGSKMTLVLRSKKSELKKDNRQKISR